MDKRWMQYERGERDYMLGIHSFLGFVRDNSHDPMQRHVCPCRKCLNQGTRLTVDEISIHLFQRGMMTSYTTWDQHGEPSNIHTLAEQRKAYFQSRASSSGSVGPSINPTLDFLDDAFPFRHEYDDDFDDEDAGVQVDPIAKAAYDKYNRLLSAAKTPIYEGSHINVLDTVIKLMQLKVKHRQKDKHFDDYLRYIKEYMCPPDIPNIYPDSYAAVKKILKDLGMGYEVIHACEYGCILFYKEHARREKCPVCGESRYEQSGAGKKIPRKKMWYFPLTPRLQRLYMSPHIAKEMRWHGERIVADDEDLKHPADGDSWKEFDKSFPDFASDIRNVRLGLATDGFNPFGATALSHSTWPVVVMPYNLPPSMCMQKEFNMLVLLIAGPKSPGKCLNVFMRPLIDELKMLWSIGVSTYDPYREECFMMRAAIMWTISDFPGLGMLGGIQTKGFKACPHCLDDVGSVHSNGRTSYPGYRRWLPLDNPIRQVTSRFNGKVERRTAPVSRSGFEIERDVRSHASKYGVVSTHPRFKQKSRKEKLCWTHYSIFWELPYWSVSRMRHALDVMHIEKNVCDNVFGTVLGIDGKTKDDVNTRATWQAMGIRPDLWQGEGSSSRPGRLPPAPYTVDPDMKREVFEWIADTKYPFGYAGSLKNKVNLSDKKFYGLKTHDCHVMLQRVLPVVIRPYLPLHIVDALIGLSRFFQKLCARELKKSDVREMQQDIIMILCKLEKIFPVAFFTIMVHLMIHLPKQILLTGPVHFTWMFPVERQLGDYKKSVTNKRYPEGCIAEKYIVHECVTFINLYKGDCNSPRNDVIPNAPLWNISVVSDLVKPKGYVANKKLSKAEVEKAHWCVMETCVEAQWFMEEHRKQFVRDYPLLNDEMRKKNWHPYFLAWITQLGINGDPWFKPELQILAGRPQSHYLYSQCDVNGVKFIIEKRDRSLKTQNSGVMVVSDDIPYYGVLESIVELRYPESMPAVLFKCRWYNTDPDDPDSTKFDHGLLSVDTSTSWFEDSPFVLATTVQQVFYQDDPKASHPWTVVNVMSHRGTYSATTLAREDDVNPTRQYQVVEPYQETNAMAIRYIPICDLSIDLGNLHRINVEEDEDVEEDNEADVEEDDEADVEEDDEADGFNNDIEDDDIDGEYYVDDDDEE